MIFFTKICVKIALLLNKITIMYYVRKKSRLTGMLIDFVLLFFMNYSQYNLQRHQLFQFFLHLHLKSLFQIHLQVLKQTPLR